ACQAMLDSSQAFQLLSGYRSPQTNAMLRRKSSRVARNSLHMVGKAADLRMSNRSTTQIARAATTCRAGGVGRYSRAGFVHMDCGPIRTWRG
ncbi:MAG: YcbK family protein, partial [Paracoccaceae bacterium]